MILKDKLKTGQPVFGAWTSLGHPSIAEILTRAGVDFIGIDLEHSTISPEQSQQIIAAAHASSIACLPRVGSLHVDSIRSVLDSGADGIIVPNICRRREVDQVMEWMFYPPMGRRSYGVARAQGYGFDFQAYAAGWNRRAVLIAQIESAAGVEAAEEILTHPAVDGVLIGPYDISGSLGMPGALDHPQVQSLCRRVLQVAQRQHKACGIQLVELQRSTLQARIEEGYRLVVLASDVFILWKWAARTGEMIEEVRGKAGLEAQPG